jgi:hypothetical protein
VARHRSIDVVVSIFRCALACFLHLTIDQPFFINDDQRGRQGRIRAVCVDPLEQVLNPRWLDIALERKDTTAGGQVLENSLCILPEFFRVQILRRVEMVTRLWNARKFRQTVIQFWEVQRGRDTDGASYDFRRNPFLA